MIIEAFGNNSMSRLNQLEADYGISLPKEYRDFLVKTNGGIAPRDGRATITVAQADEEIDIEVFFGLDVEECFSIDYWMQQYGEELPQGSLIIGNDTIKGFIILMETENGYQVVYWDDEHNLKASDDDSNAYLLADSFEEFLNMINGVEASNMDIINSKEEYLPLGSVVILKGGVQKLLIIGRALNVTNNSGQYFFDYGAVPYPEGIVNDRMAYFNMDSISKVVFEGYNDVENQAMIDNIHQYLNDNPDIEKGDPQNWS